MTHRKKHDPHTYEFRDSSHVPRLAALLNQFSDAELCTIRKARLALDDEQPLTASQAAAWEAWCRAGGPALMGELTRLSDDSLSIVIMRVMRTMVRQWLAFR